MISTIPPQVAVNTRTLDTHEHAKVEACPVRICEKRKLIYPYNKKEILLQVKMKGMRKLQSILGILLVLTEGNGQCW